MRIRTSVFLGVVSRPNFGCFLACSPLPLSNPHIFVFNKTVTEMNYGLKKIEYYPNNSNHTCLVS